MNMYTSSPCTICEVTETTEELEVWPVISGDENRVHYRHKDSKSSATEIPTCVDQHDLKGKIHGHYRLVMTTREFARQSLVRVQLCHSTVGLLSSFVCVF